MELKIQMLDFSNVDRRIEHLDKEQIVELIKRYYAGESVNKLKEEYNVKINNSNFYTIFPKKILEENCPYCNVPFVQDWESKSSYSFMKKSPYCPLCEHENHDKCRCKTCKKIREEMKLLEEIRKREAISNTYYEGNYEKVPESNLSLEDKLYLSVLIRGGLEEGFDYIKPIMLFENKIAPTDDFANEIILTLTGRGIIMPHSNSNINAFVDDDNFPRNYYIYKVNYRINVSPADDDYYGMIQRLMYPSQSEFEKDQTFCFEMWKKISLHECLEYLLYSMNKVGFEFKPGKKTITVFEHLLEHFSVAQIYSIIYRAIANSTKLYQEQKISKKHAANAVITSCESYGERAIAEGWSLTKYRRNYDLPETLISKVFFTSILKIAHLGFEEKPTDKI
ncbi:hypothetical protein PNH38_17420 [Anoxybacillus rupiensis]|uniref:Uncharacterized protein n=1 Tax=Anoxybacteroides rupiense TaxID=311460 RepID=A0ABD5IX96_9BACL|nr:MULTISPECIES: hypothetical protein [Anoxybacillus]MBS2773107.1 hypothetical protein [Anoxybacillus rupiensis]MDE8565622.1 hypothetical protein [Anoxybacillus rupiensis]MED5052541.1 hypothetical protein [Anoxybacillus rupiensis]